MSFIDKFDSIRAFKKAFITNQLHEKLFHR